MRGKGRVQGNGKVREGTGQEDILASSHLAGCVLHDRGRNVIGVFVVVKGRPSVEGQGIVDRQQRPWWWWLFGRLLWL